MGRLLLNLIVFGFLLSYCLSTVVVVNLILKCSFPIEPITTVYLMESDFANSIIDEDDTLASGIYDLSKFPATILNLRGEESEILGIEPYLRVFHFCKGFLKNNTLILDRDMYQSRLFNVTIDLDTGKATVASMGL